MWKKLTNINRIVVPVDLTDDSLCGVETALALSRERKTQIYLIHVMQKGAGGQATGTGENHEATEPEKECRALEEFFMNKIRPQSRFAYIVRSGVPSEEILTFSREEAADLIILPIGRRSGTDSLTPGGTSCQVIEQSNVPVLIVRPDMAAKKSAGTKIPSGREEPGVMTHDERYLQEIRKRICAKCIDRTSSGLCVTTTFDECAINRFLPEIIDIVLSTKGRNIDAYVRGLKDNVCARCEHQAPDATCDRRDEMECALDRYFPLVVEAILEVRDGTT